MVDQFTIGAVGSTYQGNGGKDTFTSTTEAILAGSVAIDGGAGADNDDNVSGRCFID